MGSEKVINFGYFVRWKREEKGFRVREKFAQKVGLTSRRLGDVEKKMAEPDLPDGSFAAIAGALGMTRDELDRAWRRTPVRVPKFKEPKPKTRRVVLAGEAADLVLDTADRHKMDVHLVALELIRAGVPRWSPDVPGALGADDSASGAANERDPARQAERG